MDPGSDEYDVIDTTAPGATSYADTTVSDGNAYSYQLQAPSGDGAAYNSDVDAINATVAIPLSAPTGLTAAANGTGEIDLSWTNNSQNNTGYIVERSDGHNFAIDDADQTWYSDTNVVAGTSYSYTVTATDDSGNASAPSASATAATEGTLGLGFLEPYGGYDSLELENSGGSDEGQPVTINLTDKFAPGAIDPAASGWSIDWGDGQSNNEGPGAGSYSHVYDDPGNYTITASTLDGSFTGTATDLVSVVDGKLTLTGNTSDSANNCNITATFTHPVGHGAQTWYVDWGDGSYTSMGASTSSDSGAGAGGTGLVTDTQTFSHSYAATGIAYTITISAQGDQGMWQGRRGFTATGELQGLDGSFTAGGIAGGAGGAQFEDDGAPWDDPAVSGDFGEVIYDPEDYTISFGDGGANDTVNIHWPGEGSDQLLPPGRDAYHTYAHAGDYLATLTGSDGLSAQTDAKVTNPTPTMTAPAAQIVDSGQAVDVSASYSGMPPNVTPVAFIDWGDGTGPHPATVSGGESGTVSAHLDHAPAPRSTAYGVRIYLYNPYDAPLTGTGMALYVWGATLGNGLDTDVLAASPSGQENYQNLVFDFPAPAGEAFDVTIATTDAADDLVWNTNYPTATDIPVLGGNASAYSFTSGQATYQGLAAGFVVGATAGNTTYDCLSYTLTATFDAAASSTIVPTGGYLPPPGACTSNKASNIEMKFEAPTDSDGNPILTPTNSPPPSSSSSSESSQVGPWTPVTTPLTPVDLIYPTDAPAGSTITIATNSTRLHFWDTPTETNLLLGDGSSSWQFTIGGDSPTKIYAESLGFSNTPDDVTTSMIFAPAATATAEPAAPVAPNPVGPWAAVVTSTTLNFVIDPITGDGDFSDPTQLFSPLEAIKPTDPVNSIINPAVIVRGGLPARIQITTDAVLPNGATLSWSLAPGFPGTASLVPEFNGKAVEATGINVGAIRLLLTLTGANGKSNVVETYDAEVTPLHVIQYRMQLLVTGGNLQNLKRVQQLEASGANPGLVRRLLWTLARTTSTQTVLNDIAVANIYLRELGVQLAPDQNRQVFNTQQFGAVPGLATGTFYVADKSLSVTKTDTLLSSDAELQSTLANINDDPKVTQLVFGAQIKGGETNGITPISAPNSVSSPTKPYYDPTKTGVPYYDPQTQKLNLTYRIAKTQQWTTAAMSMQRQQGNAAALAAQGVWGSYFYTDVSGNHFTAATIAHEMGHLMGLAHRWTAAKADDPGDGIDQPGTNLNMMSYGQGDHLQGRGDFDLIQAMAIQGSAAFL